MTGTYEWNPMPHKVDVRCKKCNGLAVFEFAEVVKIALKKDISFFQQNKLFEYQLLIDSCGHKWHGAFFFEGLHGSVKSITGLPEGYSPNNWAHSKYLKRSHGFDLGSVRCNCCGTNQVHAIDWPNEAYYSIEYKGHQLWAFNRESATDLHSFISGDERKVSDYKWRGFLLHIPTVFKTKKAREPVVKKLNRLLTC